ncbi:MAG: PolC-type DNA polymerase III [Lachnospiraceae bacterium]|nr:PolC-type DNA polymerase III [Lachnospiraceae bacterium]
MEKRFDETFPQAALRPELMEVFRDVMVERVILNRAKYNIKIYIRYDRVIPKHYIHSLEKELGRKIQPGLHFGVKIVEHYSLSEQYNLETLLEAYEDSIFLELEHYDNILFTLFKRSNPSVLSADELLIHLPDSVVTKNKEPELLDVLHRIINERFGLQVKFTVEYKKEEKNRHREENELRALRRLEDISKRYYGESDAEESVRTEAGAVAEDETQAVAEKEVTPVAVQKDSDSEIKVKSSSKKPEEKRESLKTIFNEGKKKWEKGSKKGEFTKTLRKSDNPDVIYNKDFEGEAVSLELVQDELGEIIVEGQILSMDERFLEKTGKTIIKYDISDFTDSIKIKLFLTPELAEELKGLARPGDFIRVRGVVTFDKFDNELEMGSIFGIKKIKDFRVPREDNATRKRVELHCHTKMSDMDAVSDVKDIIAQAKRFGHPALAVTDHGDIQAFPDANHAVKPGEEFKVIYGVEAYLVDDFKEVVVNDKGQKFSDKFVVFDIETTGLSVIKDKIIEIGAVKIENGEITARFSEFVNPKVPISLEIEKLTDINDSMVVDAEEIDVILPRFLAFAADCTLVAHNAKFDVSFIEHNARQQGFDVHFTYTDTMEISRSIFPDAAKHNLATVCKKLNVVNEHHHRAVHDAEATAEVFLKFVEMLREKGIEDLKGLKEFGVLSSEAIRRLRYHHAILLAKNEIGRRNLYTLVSLSNLEYYHQRPKIPKSKILEYREGLILGSACERGELYEAILEDKAPAEIAKIVDFYDYLEIQPLCNNEFQISSPRYPTVESVDDLIAINKKIVALGEAYHKPVCATCDVHFLNPEDEVYRRIILAGKGFADADEQPALYLRTTEEMLQEFSYLGSDKAEEVVVTNTNMIADMCEYVTPVRPDKCPPVIENSDVTLKTICYNKAHEMYGDPLPDIVEQRLEKELKSIIGNGFAVMYIIAQKLVWKSVEDGYLVGSRGSVGSSFVATMAGITEVNPLSPHYYCLECHYSDFYSDEVKAYAGKAGCDMPDKKCPVCGADLKKDGFDIPFETFLGFKGDKEPDIDLNFSGEYQSKAHKYTEVIFGAGQTFRAGTIGTLADKTAYGYVKNYYKDKNIDKREGEINRIVAGCVGIRRTTGQHPGGIIVLPIGEDINSFTAVQHPANDMTTDTVTTHFDYHSIDHNLLKLDILGHDDPTMIRMLQDLTGVDPVTIPLDDAKVMSLFQSTEALGVTPEQINGCKLGSLGIPEFGTDFAMQMLIDTHPTSFSDLVRIAGLSHGTDVWLGNAQTLLLEGKATISTAICTRDDIMTYLIGMGVESSLAFTIMESVRKGKGLKPEWEEAMVANNVPDWYIWSCKKIKYMFPKAHAAAYVMMAWRIAYCKINYPLAYYCAYFSIRASAFSYELMCLGQRQLEEHMREFEVRSKREKVSKKEEDSYKDMRIVQEMYARGFEFLPIDVYRAKAKNFQIIDGKIMPSFTAIEGLGEKAAESLEYEAKQGKFISIDDMCQRAKVSGTIAETMVRLGILEGLPQSNQLSIFDLVD